MKACLMHRDRHFDLARPSPWGSDDLTVDLQLQTIFAAMGGEDKFLLEVAEKAVLASSTDLDEIVYRQDIMKDCFRNPEIVRKLYDFAFDTLENERKNFWRWGSYPSAVLSGAVSVLNMFVERLKILRTARAGGAAEPGTLLDDEGTVACEVGAVKLLQVQRAGKAPMSGAEFLRGARLGAGDRL